MMDTLSLLKRNPAQVVAIGLLVAKRMRKVFASPARFSPTRRLGGAGRRSSNNIDGSEIFYVQLVSVTTRSFEFR
jgi:hypothetical protein